MSQKLVYAIDFGTTNSLLAAATKDQLIEPISLDTDARDSSILRSVLYFPTQKQCFYGARAMSEFVHRDMEGRLIRSIKKFLPVRSFVGTFIEERPMNLEDIIGLFLKEMRDRANQHFKQDVTSVVLGRPARYSLDDADDQYAEYRMERAARVAGFTEIEFCPEPLAAAREFGLRFDGPSTILVADFGGGTSDFTVLRVGEHAFRESDVLSLGGVPLAGDALDGSVMRKRIAKHFGAEVEYKVPFGSNVLKMPVHLMEKICSPADISLLRKRDTLEFFRNVTQWSLGSEDRQAMDQLSTLIHDQLGFSVFEEIEGTKRRLSESDTTRFHYTYPSLDIDEQFTRVQFEDYISSPAERIIESMDKTIAAAGIKPSEIDLVCCTGGTAKVPVLRRAIVERFGEEKLVQHNHFHSVVQGLSERARDLARRTS